MISILDPREFIRTFRERKYIEREEDPTLKERASEEELIKGPEEECRKVEDNQKRTYHGSQKNSMVILKEEEVNGVKGSSMKED